VDGSLELGGLQTSGGRRMQEMRRTALLYLKASPQLTAGHAMQGAESPPRRCLLGDGNRELLHPISIRRSI
jgi:hypothetical protein